jgi:MFS family permease
MAAAATGDGPAGGRLLAARRHAAGPLQAYLLLACGCLSVLAAVLIAPNLPRMEAHFADVAGVQYLVPVTLTIPALAIGALSLIIGGIADRYGRKRLLVWSLGFYALFGTAPLWLGGLHEIVASRAGLGLAEAVIQTCCTALIADYFSGMRRERYLAMQTTMASLSAVTFLSIGGILGEFGWRIPFAVYALSLLLLPFCATKLWEPVVHGHIEVADAEQTEGGADAQFRPWALAGICLFSMIGAIAFMGMQIELGYLLGRIGQSSPRVIGLVAAAGQLAVVVGTFLFRWLVGRRIRVSVRLVISFGLVAIGFVLAGIGETLTIVTIGSVIAGMGGGFLLPTLLTWALHDLPPSRRGLGSGAWMACFFFGQFLTPLVFVRLGESVGGLNVAFQAAGGAFVVIALLAAVSRLLVRPAMALGR